MVMTERAFVAEVEKYRDQIYRFVSRMAWDSSMVEDVFASTVLAAFENRDKFLTGTNFRAWLFRIAANKCFVANREVKRMPEPLDDEVADRASFRTAPGYRDALHAPEQFLEQCGDEVFRAFDRLSAPQRACILLKDVERFSYQEIAETLGIPVATVMTHLARGRARLRKDLLEYAQRMGIVRSTPILTALPDEGVQRNEGSAAR